jgi:hypothetical protein
MMIYVTELLTVLILVAAIAILACVIFSRWW